MGRAADFQSRCQYCTVRGSGLCRAMADPRSVEALEAAHLPARALEAGETIYRQGDEASVLFNLIEGWVGLQQDAADGSRGLLRFTPPRGVFGLEPLGVRRQETATAITPVIICPIPRRGLDRLGQAFPGLNDRLIWMIERENHWLIESLGRAALGSASVRLSHLLFSLAVQVLGRRPQPHEGIRLPLTQVHLAAGSGMTNVHVSRLLKEMKDQGLMEFRDRVLTLREPDAIEALCGASAELIALWTGDGGERPEPSLNGRRAAAGEAQEVSP